LFSRKIIYHYEPSFWGHYNYEVSIHWKYQSNFPEVGDGLMNLSELSCDSDVSPEFFS